MVKLNPVVVETVDVDVLNIGSGAAGFLAAIESSEIADSVALVTKESTAGGGSASILATYPYSSFVVDSKCASEFGFPGNEEDSPEIFFQDIVRAGSRLGDQRLVKLFTEEMCGVLKKLDTLGFEWDYSKLDTSGGHSYPRDVYGRKSTFGLEFVNTMKKGLRGREKIQLFTDIMTLDLLSSKGRVIGATGLNLKTGTVIVFRAKSTIIATGGAQNIYSRASVGKTLTGDGQAMALRAGAETINNEFVMFGLNVIWPPELAFTKGALLQLLYRARTPGRAQYLNSEGVAFMEEGEKPKREASDPEVKRPRPLTHRILSEIQEGRGSPHGGVYFSISQMTQDTLDQLSNLTKYSNWVDPSSQFDFGPHIESMKESTFVEVGLACHYFLGGISIDEQCRTTVPGLFAAGECTGNLHGARRLGGMGISQALWEGYRAGRYAAYHANEISDLRNIDYKQVDDSITQINELLEKDEGLSPIQLRKKIQTLAFEKVGLVRNGPQLEQAISEIGYIKKAELPRLYVATKNQEYNLELREALQLENMLQNLEVIARAALLRTESRGTHFRTDCPLEDNENLWANIVVRQAGGDRGVLELIKRPPVNIQPPFSGSLEMM
jgi:succinate dehydrogenase/fumarate reductase flavoprotein subunit